MKNFSIGTWMSLPNESIAEIFAKAGYEWIVIDLEHSSISINQAERLIRVIDLLGCKPFVRLSDHSHQQIKRVLDAGARGIIAPMINTKEEAQHILNGCMYPPHGFRGMGLSRAQGYGNSVLREKYINEDSHKVEIYFQIESVEGIKNINSILSLPVQGYFIGPYDLSASIGDPGNFYSPKFLELEEIALEKAYDKGLSRGFHLVEPDLDELDALKKRGYNMVAYSVDIRILETVAMTPFS